MLCRVHFSDIGARLTADTITGASFTIQRADSGDLQLWVNGAYYFRLDYSEDLASGIGRNVQYDRGIVMFTDYRFIQDTDYTIPMVEDIEDCPVCMEPYEPMFGSTCGHHCCVDCMKKMDESGLVRCPLCRSDEFKFPIAMTCLRDYVK